MFNSIVMLVAVLMLSACASDSVISESEMQTQNRADAVVSSLLFEHGLDEKATYSVHKDGSVVIRFGKAVPFLVYNEVVQGLRDNPAVKGVYAEQEGKEVCGLPHR